ncbi:MAG: DegV family protein [Anaerolineaceae bacterium]|nr:DegV family protein [Anaerolineaceae bacterium]
MSKVIIVTDSTVGLDSESIQGYPIYIVPLQVIWGEHSYLDGVDITTQQFYERLVQDDLTPSTSQPSPADFINIYKRLLDSGHQILSIHLTPELSGTMASALQARASFEDDAPIEVINSKTISAPLGFIVLEAAEAARKGCSLEECKAAAEKVIDKCGVFFAVSTLEFLQRGGRIGGAAALLGTALNLKPILEVKNERIEAVKKVRTITKAIGQLIDQVDLSANGKKVRKIAVLHANELQIAQELLVKACEYYNLNTNNGSYLTEVSPVIGTHVGPGTVGLAYLLE